MPVTNVILFDGNADPSSLSNARLAELINLAVATHAREEIAILVRERLLRAFQMATESLWAQVEDIERLQANQIHRLHSLDTFAEYYEDMRREWNATHDPSDAVFISKNSFNTYEQWAYLRRHYGDLHGFSNDQLARMKKSVLERMAGTCARWDAAHDGNMDSDVLSIIADPTRTHDDCLDEYRRLKNPAAQVVDNVADGDPLDSGENSATNSPSTSGDTPHSSDDETDGEVTFELMTDTGYLYAWIPADGSAVRKYLGRFDVANDEARPYIMGLAQQARIRVR